MAGFYDTLVARGECPPDCVLCEEACAAAKGDGGARIINLSGPEEGFAGVVKCNQCSEPACAEICPTRAIIKSDSDGVVRIDDQRCVGCGLCSLACPYGGIYYSPVNGTSAKCDNCDGKPECVEACKYDVLDFIRSRFISANVGEEALARGGRMCAGCGLELPMRIAIRTLGKDLILFSCPGCANRPISGRPQGVGTLAPAIICNMANVPSCMTGVNR